MSKKTDTQTLASVLTSLADRAKSEREKSEPYKELFKKSVGYESLLREAERKMVGVVLDACSVIEKKFGKKVSNEAFFFLKCLPISSEVLKQNIINSEGRSCCVDKTFNLLASELKNILEAVNDK